ncbi:hypothetical protein FACS1894105_02410 [Clostridia bacterium]|nr:hypothetical protein FACS1894105_02300 [Clostridia bacterium]GHU34855.1 hypothetical protein FACS1894105_02410 [Clostridia bacterium]
MNSYGSKTLALSAVAFIFFADVTVNGIDWLPDLFGAGLVFLSLTHLARVSEDFANARKFAAVLFYVSAAQIVLTILQLILRDAAIFGNREFLWLTSLTFTIVEFMLAFWIYSNLMRGIGISATVTGNVTLTRRLEAVGTLVKIFLAVRLILTILARLPSVFTDAELDGLSESLGVFLDARGAESIITPVCAIAGTLFGLFTASLLIPALIAVAKDKNIAELFADKLAYANRIDPKFESNRRTGIAYILFAAAGIFYVDITLDLVNILPDFIGCAFILAGTLALRDTANRKLAVKSAAATVLSAAAYIFSTMYNYAEIYEISGGSNALSATVTILHVLSAAAMFIVFAELYKTLKAMSAERLRNEESRGKHFTPSEIAKCEPNKRVIYLAAAFAIVKAAAVFLPDEATVIFWHGATLVAGAVMYVKWVTDSAAQRRSFS